MNAPGPASREAVAARIDAMISEISRVFLGPRTIPRLAVTALLAGGHALLEGVPGVAKTTLARAVADASGCAFRRIQFTPDLLPADITGSYVLDPREGRFQLRKGPIFAHVVLADEINRATAKTQSALLEAMQEHQVTIEGDTLPLPDPFFVIATQNPVEQAGTYPLPEAQIDRFLLRIRVGYPEPETERAILRGFLQGGERVRPVLDPALILSTRAAIQGVHVEDELLDYIVRLCTFTRHHGQVLLGASPRAGLALAQAAKAWAATEGRDFVLPDDVRALAEPVLAHRLVMRPEAEIEGVDAPQIVARALRETPPRKR
ncbi:MAG: MoxR family ATPase [Myxococcales bacterium]|nr:MoxR family ATPase [Myxococcales bacterium]